MTTIFTKVKILFFIVLFSALFIAAGLMQASAQVVNIPDAHFKAALVNNFSINTNHDGEIQDSEAVAYTGSITVNNDTIADLTGIEAFTNITYLSCSHNSLRSLGVSSNTALTILNCGFNPSLSALTLSGATALQSLSCNSDSLSSLNISANVVLNYLDCDNNHLTVLNVSTAPLLAHLACYNNYLTTLDVSANVALVGLNCYNNNLSELNLKNGNDNNLLVFSAINNPNLTCIQVDDSASAATHLTTVDAQSHFSTNCALAWNPIVYIPDDNFKTALVNDFSINTNHDGEIQVSEAVAYTGGIAVSNFSIADLTGIEAFTNIISLDCYSNQLTHLDVSSNTALTNLDCSHNAGLSSLNISGTSLLQTLNCGFCTSLSSLDLTGETALQSVTCNIDGLTSLTISGNTALAGLDCSNNKLAELNTLGAAALSSLACYNNHLVSLDFSSNTALTSVDCSVNNLAELNIKNGTNTGITSFVSNGNPFLTCIQVDDSAYAATHWTSTDAQSHFSTNCSANWDSGIYIPDSNFKAALIANTSININSDTSIQASEALAYTGQIDVSGDNISDLTGIETFLNITSLICNSNFLRTLDASHNTALTTLYCADNNHLASLNVRGLTALVNLSCNVDSLLSLDISTNSALVHLDCSYNFVMTDLYMPGANALSILVCNNNAITSLDASMDIALTDFEASGNNFSELNVQNGHNTSITTFSAYGNPNLTCIQVDDSAYSATNWTSIDAQTQFSTNCSVLNAVNNITANAGITVYPNPFSNTATLKISSPQKIENAVLKVYDLLGNEVRNYSGISDNEITIERGNLNAGIYFYKLYINNESFVVGKMTIK